MSDSLENQYDNDKFIDYYQILNVDTEAKVEDIKQNYIELAKKYHPDQKNGNSELFQLISKAYEVLANKNTRKEYDLYFLKKSYELQEDTFFSMRDQFKEFLAINDNKKKITKEELDKIYDDVFKDKDNFKETVLDMDAATKRINDINFERSAINIETTDEQLKLILENNPKLEVGEVLEYIEEINKNTNNNKEIVNSDFNTLDTLPGYFNSNFYSFIDDSENIPSNFYTMLDKTMSNSEEHIKNFNVEKFNFWKNHKNTNSKLESSDIDLYLARRKEEEKELFEEVETSLINNTKKRTDVETFLKPKDKIKMHINEDDIVEVQKIDNVKKRIF
jgi:curved DNA-binding protein CbpA